MIFKICGICALFTLAGFGQPILTETFSGNPRSSNWVYTDNYGGWANGYITCASGKEWRSPKFKVTPLEYIKVEYVSRCASNVGYIAGVGYNPDPTFVQYSSTASWAPLSLVADDYSSIYNSAIWKKGVYFTMARINADSEYIRFAGITSGSNSLGASSPEIDTVIISHATHIEVRNWVDSVFNAFNVPMNCVFAADRCAYLPRTIQKLQNGQRVRIVLLGDSVANDTGNSGFDVLLERLFPGAVVEVITAVGGSTGVSAWLSNLDKGDYQLDLQAACIAQQPDLVIIAGISSSNVESDFNQAVDTLRNEINTQFGYVPDIMLMTEAYDQFINSGLSPKTDTHWYRFVTSNSNNDYRHMLYKVSQTKHTAFFDMCGEWGQYTIDLENAGYRYRDLWRDNIHMNYQGKNIYAKVIEQFFSENSGVRLMQKALTQSGINVNKKAVAIKGLNTTLPYMPQNRIYDCHGRAILNSARTTDGVYFIRSTSIKKNRTSI